MSARVQALTWFGLLGAPLAWVVQFVVGVGTTEAACGDRSGASELGVNGVTWVFTLLGALVAVLAGLAAIAAWRATRASEGQGGAEEPPPKGRVHFLATVGIAITPLFLAIILMSGVGAIVLPECVQS